MSRTTLSEQDRREIVRYRLEKSELTYKEALLGVDNDYVGLAANRLYYSAYYAVTALLIAYGIETKTHDGVRRMFGLNFLKNHILGLEYGQTFNLLYSLRLTGDYQDRKNLDMETDVRPLVEPARALIDKVGTMARAKMGKGNF